MDIPKVAPAEAAPWPIWQRVLFRFFFLYLILQVAPWNWFGAIPGVGAVLGLYFRLVSFSVEWGNAHVFHVKDKLIFPNGSGDTSFAFAQIYLYLGLAVIGCIVWSVLDHKRREYGALM
jgi:hypothetical protein